MRYWAILLGILLVSSARSQDFGISQSTNTLGQSLQISYLHAGDHLVVEAGMEVVYKFRGSFNDLFYYEDLEFRENGWNDRLGFHLSALWLSRKSKQQKNSSRGLLMLLRWAKPNVGKVYSRFTGVPTGENPRFYYSDEHVLDWMFGYGLLHRFDERLGINIQATAGGFWMRDPCCGDRRFSSENVYHILGFAYQIKLGATYRLVQKSLL